MWHNVMPFLVVTLTTISGQLMPGSVPQLPNPALKVCLNEVGYDNVTSEYNNRFANAVNRWCKVYDRALPCVDQLLEDTETEETVRGPADWYFSMVFDKSKANKTTRTMCKSLPIVGNKLPCMRSNVRRALTCVLKMTKTVKQVLLRLYMNNDTTAAVAGKGACLMAAATAECFRATMLKCSKPVRNFIAAYHIILGGKCLKSSPPVDESDEKDEKETVSKLEEEENRWISTVKPDLESKIKVTIDPLIKTDEKTSFFRVVTEKQVIKTVLSSPTLDEEEEVYGKVIEDPEDSMLTSVVQVTDSSSTEKTSNEVKEPKRQKDPKDQKGPKDVAPKLTLAYSIVFVCLLTTKLFII